MSRSRLYPIFIAQSSPVCAPSLQSISRQYQIAKLHVYLIPHFYSQYPRQNTTFCYPYIFTLPPLCPYRCQNPISTANVQYTISTAWSQSPAIPPAKAQSVYHSFCACPIRILHLLPTSSQNTISTARVQSGHHTTVCRNP